MEIKLENLKTALELMLDMSSDSTLDDIVTEVARLKDQTLSDFFDLQKVTDFLKKHDYHVMIWDGEEVTLYSPQNRHKDYYMPNVIQEFRKETETYEFFQSMYNQVLDDENNPRVAPFLFALEGSDLSKIKDGNPFFLAKE